MTGLVTLGTAAIGVAACELKPLDDGDVTPGRCAASLHTNPAGEPFVPPGETGAKLGASFQVTIDPSHPAFMTARREPLAEPLQIQVKSGDLKIWGGVKKFVTRPDRLYLELYFINDAKTGVRDASIRIADLQGSTKFYDLNENPWAEPEASMTAMVGGIAPEGVARIQIGFDAAAETSPISFQLDLTGTATSRVSVSSAPVEVTPDGKEAWAVFPDSDVVAVIDTTTDQRIAQIEVPGRPSSVAVTPDGELVLVACATCNQLTVIDRASRAVTQVFGEAEGIGREPRNVVVSPDGARAYVSAYVGNSITVLERVGDGFRVKKQVPVGRKPLGLSVTPDSSTVFAAHYLPRGKMRDNEGWITVLAAESLAPLSDVVLRDDVNAKEMECLKLLPPFSASSGEELSFEASPTQLAGVFLAPGGASAWVPGARSNGLPIFEGKVENLDFPLVKLGANMGMMLFPLDTRDPRASRPKKLSSLIDIDDRPEEFLRCFQFVEEVEGTIAYPAASPDEIASRGATLPSRANLLSEAGIARFVSFTRGGRRALVLSGVGDEIIVLDAATHSPTTRRHFLLSGSNPTGLAVTPDGNKGYVIYENSTFASVLDLSAYADEAALPQPMIVPYWFEGSVSSILTSKVLTRPLEGVPDLPAIKETATVALVDGDPMAPVLRRGKVLFSSSNPEKYPTLSAHRLAACASCHPGGGTDEAVRSTVEGERRTIGLWGGVAGRGWLHASATHQDSTSFATLIVRERLGGTGLSEADVHALSEYTARGIPEVQRPRVDEALAETGKQVFADRCQSCHVDDHHSSGNADPGSPYGGGLKSGPVLYDIGSATDWAYAAMGGVYTSVFPPVMKEVVEDVRGDRDLGAGDPVEELLEFSPRPTRKRGQFKAPSLVNTCENATFFHDGRATSLEEAAQDMAVRTGDALTDDDLRALVEYLKTL